MTIDEAKTLRAGTDEFDAAVEAASDACAAAPKDRDASGLLLFLLQINDDHCARALYGR
jgi:hypothetical protein